MDADLAPRRRALVLTYRRYLEADMAWTAAVRETRSWFPAGRRPHRAAIGDPGSPVRRLYERRERALQQFAAAREKLDAARRRLEARRRSAGPLLLVFAREDR